MTPAERALERLRAPDGEALTALARLVVDETTQTPIQQIATPTWIASQLATALEAVTHGDTARDWVVARLEEGRAELALEPRTLRTWYPEEVDTPLRELLLHPYSPDEELVFRLIDQPATRALVREVLTRALTRFAKKLRNLDQGGLGALRAAASKTRKGLLGRMGGSGLGGGIGGLAENIVGSVADEFEHQLEARVREFVDAATGETLRTVAVHLADPAHAESYGELRVAVLDAVLDTPASTLAEEAGKLQIPELVDVVLAAIRREVADEQFVERVAQRVDAVLREAGDGTLGAWLEEVGLREVWTASTTELVAARLQAVVRTDGFSAWWLALFA